MKERRLYVIRDKVADDDGPIFEAPNDAVAYRSYVSLMSKVHDASDFELRCVGFYDADDHAVAHYRTTDDPARIVDFCYVVDVASLVKSEEVVK